MENITNYIIGFLLNGNGHLASSVGYTDEPSAYAQYDVVIKPSGFFNDGNYGKQSCLPKTPLPEMDGTPILFGDNTIEAFGSTLVLHADFIASTFYMVSRYEEWVLPDKNRDQHLRYIGRESLPFTANFITRPIVDEYSKILLDILEKQGAKVIRKAPRFDKIFLTHDIDFLTNYRHLRGLIGGCKRNLSSLKGMMKVAHSLSSIENDPAYTFQWMMEQDEKLKEATCIYFIKSAVRAAKEDYPQYSLSCNDFQHLFSFLKKNNAKFGLHASYYSGSAPERISQEKKKLESHTNISITSNRWHFLRTIHSCDFEELEKCGITDDFTMGYADIAGFRLGTSRAVKWINPRKMQVSNLTLHPLTAMDCTFSNSNYMNLCEEDAFQYICKLLREVKKHNGEVVLLWHNTVFSTISETYSYHRNLYQRIITNLCE